MGSWKAISPDNESGCRVYRSSGQTIATSTYTIVEYDNETYDLNAEWDSAVNYRFTAKQAGYYMITGNIVFIGLGDGKKWMIQARKNNNVIALARGVNGASVRAGGCVATIAQLDVEEYVNF